MGKDKRRKRPAPAEKANRFIHRRDSFMRAEACPIRQEEKVAAEMRAHPFEVTCIGSWLLPCTIHLTNNHCSNLDLGNRQRRKGDCQDANKTIPTHLDGLSSSNASQWS